MICRKSSLVASSDPGLSSAGSTAAQQTPVTEPNDKVFLAGEVLFHMVAGGAGSFFPEWCVLDSEGETPLQKFWIACSDQLSSDLLLNPADMGLSFLFL